MTGKQQAPDSLDDEAWIEAALELLSEGSIDKVGVEALAKRLGVTKGSFYWHFKNRAALHNAMLRTWKRRATLAIIERVELSAATPIEALQQIIDLPSHSPRSQRGEQIELAIRAWARRDERASNAVTEVDEQRLTYLVSLLKKAGFDDLDASVRAYLIYSYDIAQGLIVTSQTASNRRLLKSRRNRARDILLGR